MDRSGQAVVLGDGMAGMLTARVVADTFGQVRIIERHAHGLVGTTGSRPQDDRSCGPAIWTAEIRPVVRYCQPNSADFFLFQTLSRWQDHVTERLSEGVVRADRRHQMSGRQQESGKAVTLSLLEAMNAHDLQGQLALFDEDYRSEQPAHPARTFSGREQVRENWSKLYDSISDFRAELLRLAVVGEEEWGEWIWRGTREDGTPLEERGVTIMGIRAGQIAWGRLYLEEIEREGADITETVRRIAGREQG
jgi:ketosteroid isomerase-like protein